MKQGVNFKDDSVTEVVCFSIEQYALNENVRQAIYLAFDGRQVHITTDDRRFFTGDELVSAANSLKNNQVPMILSNRTPTSHEVELALQSTPAIPHLLLQFDDKQNPDWMDFIDNSKTGRLKKIGAWNRNRQYMTGYAG